MGRSVRAAPVPISFSARSISGHTWAQYRVSRPQSPDHPGALNYPLRNERLWKALCIGKGVGWRRRDSPSIH
jgi:hypothetical protein